MARFVWGVLCSRGILDKYTNRVSLVDTVEAIRVSGDLLAAPQHSGEQYQQVEIDCTFATFWIRDDHAQPERLRIRLGIRTPDGHEHILGDAQELDLESSSRLRFFARIKAIPFAGAGEYEFFMQWRPAPPGTQRWRRSAGTPLSVEAGAGP